MCQRYPSGNVGTLLSGSIFHVSREKGKTDTFECHVKFQPRFFSRHHMMLLNIGLQKSFRSCCVSHDPREESQRVTDKHSTPILLRCGLKRAKQIFCISSCWEETGLWEKSCWFVGVSRRACLWYARRDLKRRASAQGGGLMRIWSRADPEGGRTDWLSFLGFAGVYPAPSGAPPVPRKLSPPAEN